MFESIITYISESIAMFRRILPSSVGNLRGDIIILHQRSLSTREKLTFDG